MWPLKGGLEERTGVDTISGYQQRIVDIRYHRISTAKDISTKGYIDSWCRSRGSLQKSGFEMDHCTAVIKIIAR